MAVGEVLMPVRLTLLQLWLGAWLCLLGWPQSGHSQYHSPPEVVTPLRVTGSSRGERAPGWLSYSLHFGGQRHIIHMKAKQLLVSRDLSVFTYTDEGAMQEDHPFVQRNCYYHGYVEGDPESLVSLSTCLGGLRGVLQVKDITYEIKPKSLSTTFEHLVFKMTSEETQFPPMRCALTDERIARQLEVQVQESNNSVLMQHRYKDWWTHRRTVELALLIDYERFIYKKSNLSLIQDELIDIVNVMDELYSPMEFDIFITGYEVWSKRNMINITNNIYEVLKHFCEWKKTTFNYHLPHDAAHLFALKNFGKQLGLAYVGSICSPGYNCGVDSILGDSMFNSAYIASHELGHNLGMAHDSPECTCGTKKCIMYPAKVSASKFSNCSYNNLWDQIGRSKCFFNFPDKEEAISKSRCGNAVIEEGEQCDCGSLKSCTSDPCCSLKCTLNDGATCAFGLCCKNCQFMPSGTICRKQLNECDLPEWCNGTSHNCPRDVHVQDGTPCRRGGYCYERRCNQRDNQCQKIFGKDAKNANIICYRELNTRGDRFGNCGVQSTSFLRCKNPDILCGRIQCQNVTKLPILKDHTTVHWIHVQNLTCWGTDYHTGITMPDIGVVTSGTACGPGYVCISGKCVSIQVWKSPCTPLTCNEKGVCNNHHHCHCTFDWDPPFCRYSGHGGSVDSGPPPRKIVPQKPVQNSSNRAHFFLFPFILFVLCLLLLVCKKNQKKDKKEEPSAPTAPVAEESTAPAAPEPTEPIQPTEPTEPTQSMPAN